MVLAGSTPILPSMLMCDFGNLEREVRALEAAGVPALHLDVMDGVFVPNLTYGLPLVETFRRLTRLPLDVHLMIANPQPYLSRYVEAGADVVTFHAETVDDPVPLLQEIRSLGAAAGLAINPGTSAAKIRAALPDCDLVLVMSVEAGFGGQAFRPEVLAKIPDVIAWGPRDLVVEIDGGITTATVGTAAAAGAQMFVVGSGIFRQPDYAVAVRSLTQALSHEEV